MIIIQRKLYYAKEGVLMGEKVLKWQKKHCCCST